MIFLYIILGAIILYFVIKNAVKNGISEAHFEKDEKKSNHEIEKLLESITSKKNEVVMLHDSKEMKDKAVAINNESLKVSSSSKPVEEKISILESYKNEIVAL